VSYSLYLVHATLLWGVVYALYPKYGAGIIFVVWMFLLIPTTFLFWKLIEDPANQRGRRLASTITGPDITSREANAAGKLN
jgi:peptidoglycan/LPS O-acetylase OafA/YrhL